MRHGQGLGTALPPQGIDFVTQLRDQHRRRLLAVVAHAVATPADVEHFARGQQRFEHELTIVIAAGTVARAGHAGQGHEVKVGLLRTARVVAIVHAQQTHHLERNRTHGHERAERDPTCAKALLQPGHAQGLKPSLAHDGQGDFLRKLGAVTGAQPVVQCLLQGLQGLAVGFGVHLKTLRQQGPGPL